jgi:hypothetical protein
MLFPGTRDLHLAIEDRHPTHVFGPVGDPAEGRGGIMTLGEELKYVREVMAWDMPLAELVRRAGVTQQQWRDLEADRLPVPEEFWDLLMALVGDWDEEQRSHSPLN